MILRSKKVVKIEKNDLGSKEVPSPRLSKNTEMTSAKTSPPATKEVSKSVSVSSMPDEHLFYKDITGSKDIGRIKKEKKSKILSKRKPPVKNIRGSRDTEGDINVPKKKKKFGLPNQEKMSMKKHLKKLKAETRKILESKEKPNTMMDLWRDEPLTNQENRSEFLPLPPQIKPHNTMNSEPMAKVYQPAVHPGHPGTSYRPVEKDHLELVKSAVNTKKKKQVKDKKKTTNAQPRPPVKTKIEQETSDFNLSEEKCINLQDDEEISTPFKPPKTPRVTHKERLRRKRAILEKRKLRKKILSKRVFNPEWLTKKLKEVELRILKNKIRSERRSLLKELKQTATQSLSKHKFKPAPLEILPRSELPSTLRALRPTGNLLKDRYESLLQRNIIETKVRGKKTQKKYAMYLNPTYRHCKP